MGRYLYVFTRFEGFHHMLTVECSLHRPRQCHVLDSDRWRDCRRLDFPAADLSGVLAYRRDSLHHPEEVVVHPHTFDGMAELAILDEKDAVSWNC